MNTDEKLSIPLTNALVRIQKDSRIKGNDVAMLSAAILVAGLPVFLALARLPILDGNVLEVGRAQSVLFMLILPIIISCLLFRRITRNRMLLCLYKDNHAPTPVLELNKDEISVPLLLLPYKHWNLDYTVLQLQITIPWIDVLSWDSVYLPEDMYTGEKGTAAFNIRTLNNGLVTIERHYLAGKDQEIINYANRFIQLPIDGLKHKSEEAVDLWASRLMWGIILSFALFLITLAFAWSIYKPHY